MFETEKVDELRNWSKAKRGQLQLRVLQIGEHKFVGAARWEWRTGGGGSPLSATRGVQQTAAIAMLDAARYAFDSMCAFVANHPEDVVPLRELHTTITVWLRNLSATVRVLKDWEKNHPPPEKAVAPKPAPAQAKTKKEPLPPIDTSQVPAWAQPMVDDNFMIHCGTTAWLCRGWLHTVKTYAGEGATDEDLRALYDRKNWQDNGANEPFDFGGMIVRLTDAPA